MLPSKYAPGGLRADQSARSVTTGRVRPPRPVDYVLRTIESRVSLAADSGADIEMVPMDDVLETEAISDYVVQQRSHGLDGGEKMQLDMDHFAMAAMPLGDAFLVVDTNFLLSHLNILNDLKRSGPEYRVKVVVPQAAIRELDGLKKSTRTADAADGLSGKTMGHLARWANDWIYAALAASDDTVVGQKMSQVIDKYATQDDAILDCCLYFQKTYPNSIVVLLSNDKNLCLKALANDVLTVSYRPKMTAAMIGDMVLAENRARHGPKLSMEVLAQMGGQWESRRATETPPDLTPNYLPPGAEDDAMVRDELMEDDAISGVDLAAMNRFAHDYPPADHQPQPATPALHSTPAPSPLTVLAEMLTLATSAVHKCMKAAYGDDLDLIRDYDHRKVTSWEDVIAVLESFWLPVFSSYFHKTNISFLKGRHQEHIKHVHMSADPLDFTSFWLEVLKRIYQREMNAKENDALGQLIERWKKSTAS